jgi:histidyl-tRNA synthetase
MKAQLKSADRIGAKFTAILGDDELARGEIALKEMATGEQRMVALSALADELSR